MNDEFTKDMIDGKIIDWSKLSTEELKKMKETLKLKEKLILEEIDKELDRLD